MMRGAGYNPLMSETMNFLRARAEMVRKAEGADDEWMAANWDAVQDELARLPILSRCSPEQVAERVGLLGLRAGLLKQDATLIDR